MTSKFAIILASLVLIVSFQNCGNNMSFDGGALVAKSDLGDSGDSGIGNPDVLPGEDGPGDDGSSGGGTTPPGSTNPPGASNPPGSTNPPVVMPPPGSTPPGTMPPGTTPPYAGNPPKKNPGGGCGNDRDDGRDDDKDDSKSAMSYVCILEGPGKSVKLSYVADEGAWGDESASQAACMSKNACLNIASKAFNVKSAESRGFCKSSSSANGGHVQMTDKEVEDATVKAGLLRVMQEAQASSR